MTLLLLGGCPAPPDEEGDTGTILSVGGDDDDDDPNPDCDQTCSVSSPDTACEEFTCHLIEVCCLDGVGETTSGVPCGQGSSSACASRCGIAADCAVFTAPDDPTDPVYLQAVQAYSDCLSGC